MVSDSFLLKCLHATVAANTAHPFDDRVDEIDAARMNRGGYRAHETELSYEVWLRSKRQRARKRTMKSEIMVEEISTLEKSRMVCLFLLLAATLLVAGWGMFSTSVEIENEPDNEEGCFCNHGHKANEFCPYPGVSTCVECDPGYHPQQQHGTARLLTLTTCDLNYCVCAHGKGVTAESCSSHLSARCERCDEGYELTNPARLCTAIETNSSYYFTSSAETASEGLGA